MERLNVTIEVLSNNVGPKRANVRGTMLVSSLIANVQDKFNLDGRFDLFLKGNRQPLNPEADLSECGVVEGSLLACARLREDTGTLDAIRQGVRLRFSKKFRRVSVLEESNRIEYDLLWYPAIIGRKDQANPSNNRLLAVDLGEAEESTSVSRHHACITEQGGSFFIESVNDRNLTIVNGTKIRPGTKYPLPAGAVIQVGNLSLTFNLVG
jgi:FHA domain